MKFPKKVPTSRRQTGAMNQGLILALALGAILLLGGLAYFFFMQAGPGPDGGPVEPPPPTSKQARPDSAREVISALKAQEPVDYAAALEQAEEFREDGELADAQLLYFFAARGGNSSAALGLAEMYDPVRFDTTTSLMDEPDVFQAYKWYLNASQGGESAADERLAELRTWVEDAAAKGDQSAEQLLLQWEL